MIDQISENEPLILLTKNFSLPRFGDIVQWMDTATSR